ncbi:hypothetical protein BWX39_06290 [Prevotella intermedia ATCC 25611 = DSM 20706]|uniref:DUF488 domain-containing protein n=1 Tax=Prevotella intermedia TaxID=28131 RepID=A0A2D3N8M0_PREIN|nr:DUF488 family protein [Prevotella intermedia]APW32273.1 hypothetical protein BWX39_06290 [Prevotella intermedia ATCC 25611 = DSM 20706]ATV51682.1 DUF488 domain-containing protein [Prevotella intermedia]SUB95250.1 Uncharacterized conserved protein [Prevotella intermedia]
MKKANELKIKRVYLTPEEGDGYRILIDRLWPRGIAKEKACIDEWNKAITPSSELRKWFGHKEENYATFAEKYRSELDNNPEAMPFANHIKVLLESSNVTLLYGAKRENCNHAIILRDWLINK